MSRIAIASPKRARKLASLAARDADDDRDHRGDEQREHERVRELLERCRRSALFFFAFGQLVRPVLREALSAPRRRSRPSLRADLDALRGSASTVLGVDGAAASRRAFARAPARVARAGSIGAVRSSELPRAQRFIRACSCCCCGLELRERGGELVLLGLRDAAARRRRRRRRRAPALGASARGGLRRERRPSCA